MKLYLTSLKVTVLDGIGDLETQTVISTVVNIIGQVYLRAANDGAARMNGNSRGEVYLNCVTDSYRNTPNGEGHHLFHMYMMNCPNSDNANYWSYRWNGAGGNLTEGGNGMGLWGGGSWRGASASGNSYPITGLRLYYTEGGKTVSQGAHTIVSVYGLAGHEGRNIGEALRFTRLIITHRSFIT